MKFVIEILNKELVEYEKCKQKSIENYNNKQIDLKKHKIHLKNLKPKIKNLQKAIEMLKS